MISSEKDILEFAEFINIKDGTHQVFLAERKKYVETVKNRHLRVEICTNLSPEEFLKVVKSFEPFVENRDASALYCTTNPRSTRKACRKFMEVFNSAIFDQNENFLNNIHSEWSSILMSSKGDHKFTTIDIDDKSLYPEIVKVFEEKKLHFTEVQTRSGYHLLFENSLIIPLLKKFEQTIGDIACPIPGTFQGGHNVKMKK